MCRIGWDQVPCLCLDARNLGKHVSGFEEVRIRKTCTVLVIYYCVTSCPKHDGLHQQCSFLSLTVSLGGKIRQGTVGMAAFCCSVTGASAGGLKGWGPEPSEDKFTHVWSLLLAVCKDLSWVDGRTPTCVASLMKVGLPQNMVAGFPRQASWQKAVRALSSHSTTYGIWRLHCDSTGWGIRPGAPGSLSITSCDSGQDPHCCDFRHLCCKMKGWVFN